MSKQSNEGTPLDRFAENDAAEFTRHLEERSTQKAVNPWGLAPDAAQPEEELSLLTDGEAHEDSVNAAADERTQFAQNLADATGGTVYHQGHAYEADPAGPPFDMPLAPAVPAPPAFDMFRPTPEAQHGMPPLFRGIAERAYEATRAMEAANPLVPIEFDSLADPGYSGLAWHYRGALRHDAANFTWHGSTASNLELRTLEAHLIEALVCLRAEMAERDMTSGRLVLGDG